VADLNDQLRLAQREINALRAREKRLTDALSNASVSFQNLLSTPVDATTQPSIESETFSAPLPESNPGPDETSHEAQSSNGESAPFEFTHIDSSIPAIEFDWNLVPGMYSSICLCSARER
jgi:hypothetical protein